MVFGGTLNVAVLSAEWCRLLISRYVECTSELLYAALIPQCNCSTKSVYAFSAESSELFMYSQRWACRSKAGWAYKRRPLASGTSVLLLCRIRLTVIVLRLNAKVKPREVAVKDLVTDLSDGVKPKTSESRLLFDATLANYRASR